MDDQLKDRIISSCEEAFLSLTLQVHHMLDVVQLYMLMTPLTADRAGTTNAYKHADLSRTIQALGKLPLQFADQLQCWKKNEPRLLSREGIEQEILNEVWITLEVLFLFFIGNDVDVHPYNRQKAEVAFNQLRRANRIL